MTTMSCRILRPPDPAGCSPPPPEGNTPAGEAKEAGRREGRGEVVRGRRDAEGKQEEKDMGALTPTRSHVQVYILLPSLNALDLASAGYTLAHPSHGHLNHRNGHSCDVFLWSASDPRHQVRRRGNMSAGAPKGEVKPPPDECHSGGSRSPLPLGRRRGPERRPSHSQGWRAEDGRPAPYQEIQTLRLIAQTAATLPLGLLGFLKWDSSPPETDAKAGLRRASTRRNLKGNREHDPRAEGRSRRQPRPTTKSRKELRQKAR